MTNSSKFRVLIIIFLVAIITTGSIIAWSRYSPNQPIDIFMPPHPQLQGDIYIGGAVNNPGFYPLKADDSVEGIIQVAGGTTDSADLSRLELYVPNLEE